GLDAQPGPVVEFLLEQGTHAPGLEPERVAAEVDGRAAVGSGREVEAVAKTTQRIVMIHLPGERFVGLEVHGMVRPLVSLVAELARVQPRPAAALNSGEFSYVPPRAAGWTLPVSGTPWPSRPAGVP